MAIFSCLLTSLLHQVHVSGNDNMSSQGAMGCPYVAELEVANYVALLS